ncbi:MAG: hypothetical protein ACRD4C_03940 [Candidatus Acidiferrales bacterium]
MTERAGIFDNSENESDFDIGGFTPQKDSKADHVPPEAIREVSERSEFRSREPTGATKPKKGLMREPRRHRTGRNVQLSLKVRQEASDLLYDLADSNGWVLGETFERAVEALKKQLAK